jgi:hypothetical protein
MSLTLGTSLICWCSAQALLPHKQYSVWKHINCRMASPTAVMTEQRATMQQHSCFVFCRYPVRIFNSVWSVSWERWVHSPRIYISIYLRSLPILSSHLRLRLPSCFFSSDLETTFLAASVHHRCVLHRTIPYLLARSVTWARNMFTLGREQHRLREAERCERHSQVTSHSCETYWFQLLLTCRHVCILFHTLPVYSGMSWCGWQLTYRSNGWFWPLDLCCAVVIRKSASLRLVSMRSDTVLHQ